MKIVIVSHGSFNPVHLGHLEMMIRARQALTAAGHEVCGGIFAITSTQHIERKGAHALSNALRLALLRRACADGGCEWLRAADGSASHSADRFMKQLNFGAGILGVSVQGSDVQLRCPHERIAPLDLHRRTFSEPSHAGTLSALSSHASSSRSPTRPPESVPAGRED